MTKNLLVSAAVAALAASSIPGIALAQTNGAATPAQTSTPAAPQTAAAGQIDGRVVEEAVDALRETQRALVAIDRNKPNDAIAALTRATGKLEIVLARTPNLALAPVDFAIETHDVIATQADVDKLRGEAAAAIAQGRLQVARRLISDLASETVVHISKLPLATYPDSLKRAAALLHQGKAQEAKVVLQTTLNTIVIEDVIIPLPLVRAQAALEEARSLLENDKRTPADNTKMRKLLATARVQLRLGRSLGYATDDEMADLIATVDDIERKTDGSQSAKGLLDPIGPKFDEARKSSQQPK